MFAIAGCTYKRVLVLFIPLLGVCEIFHGRRDEGAEEGGKHGGRMILGTLPHLQGTAPGPASWGLPPAGDDVTSQPELHSMMVPHAMPVSPALLRPNTPKGLLYRTCKV